MLLQGNAIRSAAQQIRTAIYLGQSHCLVEKCTLGFSENNVPVGQLAGTAVDVFSYKSSEDLYEVASIRGARHHGESSPFAIHLHKQYTEVAFDI